MKFTSHILYEELNEKSGKSHNQYFERMSFQTFICIYCPVPPFSIKISVSISFISNNNLDDDNGLFIVFNHMVNFFIVTYLL